MQVSIGGQEPSGQAQVNREMSELLCRLNSRELMDTLMALDMAMGGTNEERIARLLSTMQPLDLLPFLSHVTPDRMSSPEASCSDSSVGLLF